MTNVWYYRYRGQEVGPLTPAELLQAVRRGDVTPDTEVCPESGGWLPAGKVNGLFEQAARVNSSAPTSQSPSDRVFQASQFPQPKVPGSSSTSNETLQVLDSVANDRLKVEILGYRTLSGSSDPSTAQMIFFANQAGLQLKQIRMTLQNSEVQIEAGALHFMHGRIEVENRIGGMGGLGKAMLNKLLTNETAFKPRYRGTGTIYLEPSFGHFLIYQLNNEEIIADRGLFFCSEGALDVGAVMQKNVSSALLGGEGLFQTKIRGTGICVFELPVPLNEVRCIQLNNETLSVDGNFALMRSGNIEFTVEKSTKSLFGTLSSGEGLLQTFRGTGRVWLAPTQGVYQKIRWNGFDSLSSPPKSSSTTT